MVCRYAAQHRETSSELFLLSTIYDCYFDQLKQHDTHLVFHDFTSYLQDLDTMECERWRLEGNKGPKVARLLDHKHKKAGFTPLRMLIDDFQKSTIGAFAQSGVAW